MAKSQDAFRTISEVSERLGVPAHVLRFWESRFNQIKPLKRAGGRRYYRPADMHLLSGIRGLLHDDGITIKGVQKILREKGVKHVVALGRKNLEETASPADSAAETSAPSVKEPDRAPVVTSQDADTKKQTAESHVPDREPVVHEPTAVAATPATQTEPEGEPLVVDSGIPGLAQPDIVTVQEIDPETRRQRIIALHGRLKALRDRVRAEMDAA